MEYNKLTKMGTERIYMVTRTFDKEAKRIAMIDIAKEIDRKINFYGPGQVDSYIVSSKIVSMSPKKFIEILNTTHYIGLGV